MADTFTYTLPAIQQIEGGRQVLEIAENETGTTLLARLEAETNLTRPQREETVRQWEAGEFTGNTIVLEAENGNLSVNATNLAEAYLRVMPGVQRGQSAYLSAVHAIWDANPDLKETTFETSLLNIDGARIDWDLYRLPGMTYSQAYDAAVAAHPDAEVRLTTLTGATILERDAKGNTEVMPTALALRENTTINIPVPDGYQKSVADAAAEFAGFVTPTAFQEARVVRDQVAAMGEYAPPENTFMRDVVLPPRQAAVGNRIFTHHNADPDYLTDRIRASGRTDQYSERPDYVARLGRGQDWNGETQRGEGAGRAAYTGLERSFQQKGYEVQDGTGGRTINTRRYDEHDQREHYNTKFDAEAEGPVTMLASTIAREAAIGPRGQDDFSYRTINPFNWESSRTYIFEPETVLGLNDYAVFRDMRLGPRMAEFQAAIESGDEARIEEATLAFAVDARIAARMDVMYATIERDGQPYQPVEEVFRMNEAVMAAARANGVDIDNITFQGQDGRTIALSHTLRDPEALDQVNLFNLPEQLRVEGDFTVGIPVATEAEFRDNKVFSYFPLTDEQVTYHSWWDQDRYERNPELALEAPLQAVLSASAQDRSYVQFATIDSTAPQNSREIRAGRGEISAPADEATYRTNAVNAVNAIVADRGVLERFCAAGLMAENQSYIQSAIDAGALTADNPARVGRGGVGVEQAALILEAINEPERFGFRNHVEAVRYVDAHFPGFTAQLVPTEDGLDLINRSILENTGEAAELVWERGVGAVLGMAGDTLANMRGNTNSIFTVADNQMPMALQRVNDNLETDAQRAAYVDGMGFLMQRSAQNGAEGQQSLALTSLYRLAKSEDAVVNYVIGDSESAGLINRGLDTAFGAGAQRFNAAGRDPRAELAALETIQANHNQQAYLSSQGREGPSRTISGEIREVTINPLEAPTDRLLNNDYAAFAAYVAAQEDGYAIMHSKNGNTEFLVPPGALGDASAYERAFGADTTIQDFSTVRLNTSDGQAATPMTQLVHEYNMQYLEQQQTARLAAAEALAGTQTVIGQNDQGGGIIANELTQGEIDAISTITDVEADKAEVTAAFVSLMGNATADQSRADTYMANLAHNDPRAFAALLAGRLDGLRTTTVNGQETLTAFGQTLQAWDNGDSSVTPNRLERRALNTLENALDRAANGDMEKLNDFIADAQAGDPGKIAALNTLSDTVMSDPAAKSAIAGQIIGVTNASQMTDEQLSSFIAATTTPVVSDHLDDNGRITGIAARGAFPQLPIDIAIALLIPGGGDTPDPQTPGTPSPSPCFDLSCGGRPM